MKTETFSVNFEMEGERLDNFLSIRTSRTRSFIQRLVKRGFVTVNLRKEKSGYRIKDGDLIEMTLPEQPEGQLIPEKIPLDIIFEDRSIVVVNKPPGMVVYPATGHTSGTLMNGLVSICDSLSSIGAPLRPGVVHRLDKDTSGIIVVAKDDDSYFNINEQFRERLIEKKYLALLYGSLKEDSGEISASIGRSPSDRKKMSTRARSGKEAITKYDVISRFRSATLAKVRIITGRTHQIRVHFASTGHPVLGDSTYGKKSTINLGQKIIKFKRQMLHANTLKLRHPLSGEMMEFEAPMPEDMKDAIKDLEG